MRQGILPPVFFIGTKMVSEIDFQLGEDARCSLRRIVGNRPYCDQPAQWAVKFACCGHVKVVCAKHRNLPESIAPAHLVCAVCRADSPAILAVWPV